MTPASLVVVSRVKPFSEACERNKEPILAVLRGCLADRTKVLEIGSGTGQHAVHFAAALPHLVWQPSDVAENLAGIAAWCAEADLSNLLAPIELDLTHPPQEIGQFDSVDAVFTANTLHIVGWAQTQTLFDFAGRVLPAGGVLAVYGPFRYGGRHTSESNARFDLMLRSHDPDSGIRNFEEVDALARGYRLSLVDDRAMPANNRTLVWRKAAD